MGRFWRAVDFPGVCWYFIRTVADKNEFETIAIPYLDSVFREAVALCQDRKKAEDLAQATFLKAFERFESFEKGSNCKAWLLTILRNKWVDQLRHKNVVGEVLAIEEEMIAEPQRNGETGWSDCQDLLESFSDEQVIHALKELPYEQRLSLFLIDVEQLSQKDVAEIMDVAVGTVKSRTSRARAILKKTLLSYAKDMGFIRGER
ncbi:MAG: sigma-70 family RNA polymerase sigma factor [Planctomycetes bacterium]|nr:sigma-70 family RNA polymerase sigma factor [Planctomycetota bacterium]